MENLFKKIFYCWLPVVTMAAFSFGCGTLSTVTAKKDVNIEGRSHRIKIGTHIPLDNDAWEQSIRISADTLSFDDTLTVNYSRGEFVTVQESYNVNNTTWRIEDSPSDRASIEVNHNVDATNIVADFLVAPHRDSKLKYHFGGGLRWHSTGITITGDGKRESFSFNNFAIGIALGAKYLITPKFAITTNFNRSQTFNQSSIQDVDFGFEYQATDNLRLGISTFNYSQKFNRNDFNSITYLAASSRCLNNPDLGIIEETGGFFGRRSERTCEKVDLSGNSELEISAVTGLQAQIMFGF